MLQRLLGDMLALKLTAKAYVLDVRFEKDFETDVVLRATEAFRVHRIERLPEKQRDQAVGFMGNVKAFEQVWKAFKPGEDVPEKVQ